MVSFVTFALAESRSAIVWKNHGVMIVFDQSITVSVHFNKIEIVYPNLCFIEYTVLYSDKGIQLRVYNCIPLFIKGGGQ